EYYWFAGLPVGQYDLSTSTPHWTFPDHLGTPIIETDAARAIDWRAEYEPYGRVFTYRTGSTRHQPPRLPGQEDPLDGERSYNVFRWYRDGWGRYTQADPVGLRGGLNTFVYALNRPTSVVDPRGLTPAQYQFPPPLPPFQGLPPQFKLP